MNRNRLLSGTFVLLSLLLSAMSFSEAQQPAQPLPKGAPEVEAKPARKYGRGRVPLTPQKRAKYHAEAFARHGHRMKSLPNCTADTFDSEAMFGNGLPVGDQGSCGSCYEYSSCDVCTMAFVKGGYFKPDRSQELSQQYGLDCQQFGGCGGGNESEVIDHIKTKGFPLTSDYGPYQASEGRCKYASQKLYQIGDWGYCTPSQQEGVASTQDMKNAIARYGAISVAFDAGGCDNYRAGDVMTGGGNNVDHAVICTGWKTDSNGKTIFRGKNQWGKSWGDAGYFWIQEGAWSWGTEAIWVSVAALPPPPGPTPPPGPGPLPPPNPNGVPVFTSATTATAVIGQQFSYQATATNTPILYAAVGLPTGFTCTTTGAITGTATTTATSTVTLYAVNTAGVGSGTLTLAQSVTPPLPQVGIQLTDEQVTSVLLQAGALQIKPETTIRDIAVAMVKLQRTSPCTTCPDKKKDDEIETIRGEVRELKKANLQILELLGTPKK